MPKKHEDVSMKGFAGLCATFLVRLAKVAARMSPDLVHNWTRNGDAIERLLMQMIPPSEQELAEAQAVVRRTVNGEFRKDRSGLWHYVNTKDALPFCIVDAIQNRPTGPVWFWFSNTPAPIFPEDVQDHTRLYNRWLEWGNSHHNDECKILTPLLKMARLRD
jgi:hypothetical protein